MVQERGREEGNDSPSPSSHQKNIQKAGQRWQSEQSQTISIFWMQSVAFLHLSIALQAVVLLVKKLGDFNIADRMIAIREFGGQSARALADPSQTRTPSSLCHPTQVDATD